MSLPQKYKGIIYIIISAFAFALMAVFVRLSGDLPTFQKTFFRNFIALFFALGVLIKERVPFRPQSRRNLLALVGRAAAGTLGMVGNFYAIDHMVLSDALMLNKMSPFFVIIFSWLLLSERLTLFQGLAVSGAFAGSLFIIKPSFHSVEYFPALLGFLGGMGAGFAYCCVRYLGQHGEKGAFIVAFFSAFSCLFCLPFMIVQYQHMSAVQLLCLLGAGASAAAGQFSITAAYSCAPAREISVYDYSQVVYAALLGIFVLGEWPDALSVLGYVIIIAAAVGRFLYNRKRAA